MYAFQHHNKTSLNKLLICVEQATQLPAQLQICLDKTGELYWEAEGAGKLHSK